MNIQNQPIAMSHQIHTYPELQQQGSNIPTGLTPMAAPPRVILTSRASGNCSAFRREGDPTSLPLLLIAPSNGELQGKDLCNMF
jgi:hypothetical protein